MNATYMINQAIENPRTGELQLYPYEEYDTLAEAKKVAAREFRGKLWVIVESRIVARSKALVEANA